MPDLLDLFKKWWKQICLLVAVTITVAAVVLLIVPKKYLGVTTALPAPPYATDKTGVFSQNLEVLYSTLGSPDDLDKILGTARLDTVYTAVASRLNLIAHYNIKQGSFSLQKAALHLKNATRVIKTDYGELQVKAWDTDKEMAAAMANAVMDKLQQIHQDVQTTNNALMLTKILEKSAQKKIDYQQAHDSLSQLNPASGSAQLLLARQASLIQQIQEYEKLANQYQLMVDAKPRALIVIERATPGMKPDKPDFLLILIAAAVLSFFFGLLTALVLEKRTALKK